MRTRALLLKRLIAPMGTLSVKWQLDCPTRGVVIFDVAVGEALRDAPLHWRAGNWRKPPLDIRLNRDGVMENIQLTIQDESVDVGHVARPSDTESALPQFDIDAWPPERYLDVPMAVVTVRLPSGELYTRIGDAPATRSVSVTRVLRLDFAQADQLVGIAVGPLTVDEWQLIAAAAPP